MAESRTSGIAEDLRRIGELLDGGDTGGAISRCHALLTLLPHDPETLRLLGLGYLRQDNLTAAEKYLAQAMRFGPVDSTLINGLGVVRLRQGAYQDAAALFADTLKIRPTDSDALSNLAFVFTLIQRPDQAESYLDRLVRVLPFSASAHKRVSDNRLSLNEVQEAIRYGRKAVELEPTYVSARLSLADALEANGNFRQAKFQYLAVLQDEPRHPGALAGLLSLKNMSVEGRHVSDAMESLAGLGLLAEDRVRLNLALASHLDRQGEYDKAFERLSTGNAVRHANHPFDAAAYSRSVDRVVATFSASTFAALSDHARRSKRPIFIVGMPRSGTTLVEQMLASHSQVVAGGELSTIINIASQIRVAEASYPEAVIDLDESSIDRLARHYLDKLDRISLGAARITDKMPFNFMHLGLITMLFPQAKILHCVRDPLDTCLSCYFTTFNERLQFASNLETLGRYWLDYHRLMQHWQATLPVPIYQIRYERIVTNTKQCVRELLDFCELPWESACLHFYESRRGIRTPSRWQVRQPIYGQSIGRWRHYERHLHPLCHALSSVLE